MPPGMTLEQMLQAMGQQEPESAQEEESAPEPDDKPAKRTGKLSQ